MTAAILSGRRVVAPLGCRVVTAAVGRWVERRWNDGGTGQHSYCRDAARDVFVIETPGGGVMVFQKSGTV